MINKIAEIWNKHEGAFALLIFIASVVGVLGVYFGLLCLKAWLVMLLWNWVAVSLWGVPVLTFWLSVGLVCLLHVLLGLVKITVSGD